MSDLSAAIEAAKQAMRVHGGASMLLPADEFDCCAEEAVRAAAPHIRAAAIQEGREQAARAIELARAAIEGLWSDDKTVQSLAVGARLSGFADAAKVARGQASVSELFSVPGAHREKP